MYSTQLCSSDLAFSAKCTLQPTERVTDFFSKPDTAVLITCYAKINFLGLFQQSSSNSNDDLLIRIDEYLYQMNTMLKYILHGLIMNHESAS